MLNGFNIPAISSQVPAIIKKPLDALRQAVNNAVSNQDLINTGLVKQGAKGLEVALQAVEVTYQTPAAITGLTAAGAFASIILSWDDPSMQAGFSNTNVYRASVDDIGQAVKIGSTAAPLFSDIPPNSSTSVTYFYWLRGVNQNGVEGAFNGTPGTAGKTASDPGFMMGVISSSTWAETASYDVFNYVTPTTPNGFKYKAIQSGAASGIEPVWPTDEGQAIVDGGVIWEAVAENKAIPFAIDPVSGNVFIDSVFIKSGTITNAMIENLAADKISATTLSAISANMGSINAGSISLGGGKFVVDTNGNASLKSATSGARLEIHNNVIKVIDGNGTVRVQIGDLAV